MHHSCLDRYVLARNQHLRRSGRHGWWPRLGWLVAIILVLGGWNLTQPWRLTGARPLFPADSGRPVLVLYIFAATDPQFTENLKYFVKEAVQHDTDCEYVIVIQQSPSDKAHRVRCASALFPAPPLLSLHECQHSTAQHGAACTFRTGSTRCMPTHPPCVRPPAKLSRWRNRLLRAPWVVSLACPLQDKLQLPPLPRHARYVYHANECYDWGTFGWVLRSGFVQTSKYKYFIFMNCSVRGPFLPPYAKVGRMQHPTAAYPLCMARNHSRICPPPPFSLCVRRPSGVVLNGKAVVGILEYAVRPATDAIPVCVKGKLHWTLPLLSRLTRHVKLVGPTISCEGSPLNGDFSGKWRHNPHVQSYVVATDQVISCYCFRRPV